MATTNQNTGITGAEKIDKLSDAPSSPDTSDKLDEFKRSLDSQKNSADEREKLLLDSLDKVFNSTDISLLDKIENVDAFNDQMKETISAATEIFLAIQLIKGEKCDSPMDIIDGFTFEKKSFSRSFVTALVYIQKNTDSPVSKWFLSEGFDAAKKKSKELATAGHVMMDVISGEKKSKDDEKSKDSNDSFVDGVKDFAEKNKTVVGLFAFAGAAVGGIWMYKKLFSDEKKEGESGSGLVATGAKVGLMAAGGAFVAGQILGMEEVRNYLSKDNNSWINSRYIEALTSAADGEFQNAMNSILYGAISVEDKVKYKKLATILDTDVDRVTAISRMNFNEFIDGKSSSMFSFGSSKESEEKIRARIKDFYLDDIKSTTSDLSKMTVGQVMISGLERGIIFEVDQSDLTSGQQEDVSKHKAESKEELKEYGDKLSNPEEHPDEIIEMNRKLIDDIQLLDSSVDSVWGNMLVQMEAAIGWPPDADDNMEYGDLKRAREYMLGNVDSGMSKDHEAFEEMQGQVADFNDFLVDHKEEKPWTEKTKAEYETLKKEIVDLKFKINNAIVSANETRVREGNEDIKELNMEDLMEGGEFVLVGVCGNVLKVIGWEMQELVDDETDTIVYVLAFTQVAGALTEYATTANLSPGKIVWIAAKNIVTGPVKVPFQLGILTIDAFKFKKAFEFTPDELFIKLLSGDLDATDIKQRLATAKKYIDKMDTDSTLRRYLHGISKINDVDELLHMLQNDDEIKKALEYFDDGVPPTGRIEALDKLLLKIDNIKGSTNPVLIDTKKLIEHKRLLLRLFDMGKAKPELFDKFVKSLTENVVFTTKEVADLDKLFNGVKLADFKKYLNPTDGSGSVINRLIREELPGGKFQYKLNGKIIKLVDDPGVISKIKLAAEKVGKVIKFDKIKDVLKFAQPVLEVFGIAYTVNLFYKLSTTDDKDKLREIVAEEFAAVLTFLTGMKGAAMLGAKLDKRLIPIFSIFGGIAAALGFSEPISKFIDSYVAKFPNGNEIIEEGVSGLLQDVTLVTTLRSVYGLAGTKVVQKVLAKEAVKGVSVAIGNSAIGKFTKDLLATGCGKIIKKLAASVGTKVVGAGVTAAIDGPLPIGDIIGVLLVAWAVKDVYDIATLIYNGYILSEEIEKRMTQEMEEFEIISPAEMKTKYEVMKFDTADGLLDELMKEEKAVVKIKRKGVLGYEVYSLGSAEVKNMAIFDVKGDEVASISDEDLESIISAEAEIDKKLAEKEAADAAKAA